MPDVHARLSASGSKKWINCPASVAMEEKFPDKGSEFAKEGTTAHSLAELKIRYALGQLTRVAYHKAADLLDTDEDMQDYTDSYRDFVIERYNAARALSPDTMLLVEQRLDFSDYVPDGFGTGDAVIISGGKTEIIDLKYGKGVPVAAEDNSQLMLYSLGALVAYDWLYNISKVRMTIYQPRIDNIDTAGITADELYDWGEWVSSRAGLALGSAAFCSAGKHCDDGFCKARPTCRAYNEHKQSLAYLDFKPPDELTAEEIAEVLDSADSLAKWAKTVSDFALDSALNHGVKYPGYKLVEGRSNRTYTDEAAAEKAVLDNTDLTEDDIIIKKLKGITEMENLLGRKQFGTVLSGLVVKPQGKPVLVRSEDRRPELNTAEKAAEDFKNIIDKRS